MRCRPAVDADWPSGEDVSDEVADGEVCVERKVWADEGEAAGDFDFDAAVGGGEGAELLGDAFAFGVDVGGVEWVRAAEIVFGDVR